MRETPTSIIIPLRRHGGAEVEIHWQEIECLSACKQDLFNPQVVVLEVRTAQAVWEIEAADCNGFETFSHLLNRRLTGMTPFSHWWPQATDPLRRQEAVVLYSRSNASA